MQRNIKELADIFYAAAATEINTHQRLDDLAILKSEDSAPKTECGDNSLAQNSVKCIYYCENSTETSDCFRFICIFAAANAPLKCSNKYKTQA